MSDGNQPYVRIGLDDIYREVVATRSIVSPLPAKIEDHDRKIEDLREHKLSVSDFRTERSEGDVRFADHERRIRGLESKGFTMSGAIRLAAWAAAAAGGVTALVELVTR